MPLAICQVYQPTHLTVQVRGKPRLTGRLAEMHRGMLLFQKSDFSRVSGLLSDGSMTCSSNVPKNSMQTRVMLAVDLDACQPNRDLPKDRRPRRIPPRGFGQQMLPCRPVLRQVKPSLMWKRRPDGHFGVVSWWTTWKMPQHMSAETARISPTIVKAFGLWGGLPAPSGCVIYLLPKSTGLVEGRSASIRLGPPIYRVLFVL
jgi:hypothetical protein